MPIGLKRATSGRSDSLPGPENHKKRPEIRKEEASLPETIPQPLVFQQPARHNSSRQLSVIRNLNEHLFDYLVAVIFDEVFAVQEIWKIPRGFIVDHSTFSQLQNGHTSFAEPDVLAAGEGVTRIQ